MSTRIDDIEYGTTIDQLTVPDALKKRYAFDGLYYERLKFMTHLYGGQGITPSTVTYLTGSPGSGKSTLVLQMANALHQHPDCMVLFNGGEESLFQTKLVCERLFKKQPTFYVGDYSLVDENAPGVAPMVKHVVMKGQRKSILGHARMLKKKYPNKHLVIIHDSLQTADDGKDVNGSISSTQTPVRALKIFNEHCKTTFDSAILVGQVTKAGDPAGANKLLHDIDVWIHMYIDAKDKSETQGMRIITTKKNRYGFAQQAHVLSMEHDGLLEQGAFNSDE